MISSQHITGLVLAGGRGARMGGVDKGLQNFHGTPLALHTLLRLQMQEGGLVGDQMINANRNLAAYEAFGVPVWPDPIGEYAGPLMEAAWKTFWVTMLGFGLSLHVMPEQDKPKPSSRFQGAATRT